MKAHAEELDRWREHKFTILASPTQEANFDLDRFLTKYFLDGLAGVPALHKTKDPLTLEYVDDPSKFNKAVQSIPGLKVHFASRTVIVGWEDRFERALDAEFTKLDSPATKFHIPTTEANFDLDRFLAKYFLDDLKGKPARDKTPDPITLFPFFEHRNQLREAVLLVPGLHFAHVEVEYEKRTIIGWDPDKILSLVRHMKKVVAEKRAKEAAEARTKREQEWQNILQSHHEYVEDTEFLMAR